MAWSRTRSCPPSAVDRVPAPPGRRPVVHLPRHQLPSSPTRWSSAPHPIPARGARGPLQRHVRRVRGPLPGNRSARSGRAVHPRAGHARVRRDAGRQVPHRGEEGRAASSPHCPGLVRCLQGPRGSRQARARLARQRSGDRRSIVRQWVVLVLSVAVRNLRGWPPVPPVGGLPARQSSSVSGTNSVPLKTQ